MLFPTIVVHLSGFMDCSYPVFFPVYILQIELKVHLLNISHLVHRVLIFNIIRNRHERIILCK